MRTLGSNQPTPYGSHFGQGLAIPPLPKCLHATLPLQKHIFPTLLYP